MGNISRSTTARFNDSANGSPKYQAKAAQRHCVGIQAMVPICRNIQNWAMISLMRPIFRNTGDVLKNKAYNSV
jgi:hypothetical protein